MKSVQLRPKRSRELIIKVGLGKDLIHSTSTRKIKLWLQIFFFSFWDLILSLTTRVPVYIKKLDEIKQGLLVNKKGK